MPRRDTKGEQDWGSGALELVGEICSVGSCIRSSQQVTFNCTSEQLVMHKPGKGIF